MSRHSESTHILTQQSVAFSPGLILSLRLFMWVIVSSKASYESEINVDMVATKTSVPVAISSNNVSTF